MTAEAHESLAGRGDPALPTNVRLLALGTAVLFLAYSASLLFVERPEEGADVLWDGVVYSAWMLMGIAIVIWRGRASATVGLGWYLFAAYLALNLGADLIFMYVDSSSGAALAISDFVYLSAYLFLGGGLVILSQRGRTVSPAARIDGLILGLTASAVFLLFYLSKDPIDPRMAGMESPALLYPVLDVVFLMIILAGLAPLHFRPTPATWGIVISIIAVAVGDFIYFSQVTADSYVGGTPLELTWAISNAAIITAALLPNPHNYRPRLSRRWTVFTPAAVSLVAVGLLAWTLVTSGPLLVSALALGALALASVRLILTMADLRRAGEGYEQARQDYLTGLMNRRGFSELAATWLATVGQDVGANGSAPPGGLVLIGVARVREVVDSLGREAGDELLRAIAQRLQHVVAPFPLARLEGSEFAVLVTSSARVDDVAEAAVAALDAPVELSRLSFRVITCVGVARPTAQMTNLDSCLRAADVALTQARHRGQGIVEFDPTDDPADDNTLSLMAELHSGLNQDELVMVFQPLVRVRDRRVTGAEALVRWHHPTRGLIFPDQFIGAAEQAGLIGRVTQSVLRQSCAVLRDWLDSGLDLWMSVNISGIDLMDENLPSMVTEVLAAQGLPADRLVLEITETAIGTDPERGLRTVAALRALGVRIAIDDFGVDYSSLAQLMDTPVDEIKLDGRFLRTTDTAKREAAVSATHHLASAMGATMVAEGVEDAADFELLGRHGCELAQGYYFTKPLSADAFADFCRKS